MSETYPYPKRPSEVVSSREFFNEIKPIKLTKEEKSALKKWEKPFFETIDELKKNPVRDHEIFPGAFLSDEGNRLFSAIYLDSELFNNLTDIAKNNGISFDDEKDAENERIFSDAFFEDLLEIVRDEERFRRYLENGIEFTRLQKALNLPEPLILRESAVRLFEEKEVSDSEKLSVVNRVFDETDVKKMPKSLRKRVEGCSEEWAKEKFVQDFKNASGNVENINNPSRIGKLIDLNELVERLGGLRDFKKRLKEERRSLGDSNLDKAKKNLLDIYKRYVNILIAEGRYSRRLVEEIPQVDHELKAKALDLIWGVSIEAGERESLRGLERVDHFIRGVGVEIKPDGLHVSIPEKLAEYIKRVSKEKGPEKTDEYEKYNAIEIDTDDLKKLTEIVLEKYGATRGDKAWKAVVDETRKGMAVRYQSEGKIVREVAVPGSLSKKGLVDKLSVLAHEVEGHVLRYINRDTQNFDIALLEKFSTGRSFILSEAAAMSIESETKKEMVGVERQAKPYYYIALLEKSREGSFKDCFKAVLAARAQREGKTLDELFKDEKEYKSKAKTSFSSTLRLYRGHIPFDDTSGYIPRTDQLKYIEQELVVEALKNAGVEELLYITGVDLFSVQELISLGMLDLSKIQKPKMVVAREIWPKIKEGIDKGEDIKTIIENL